MDNLKKAQHGFNFWFTFWIAFSIIFNAVSGVMPELALFGILGLVLLIFVAVYSGNRMREAEKFLKTAADKTKQACESYKAACKRCDNSLIFLVIGNIVLTAAGKVYYGMPLAGEVSLGVGSLLFLAWAIYNVFASHSNYKELCGCETNNT